LCTQIILLIDVASCFSLLLMYVYMMRIAAAALFLLSVGATPDPSLALQRPYDVLGSIDVGTGESSIFLFKGTHFILDNIFCGWIDHYGQWDPAFAGHSYVRIRELQSGKVIANVTATIGTSFVSAFVDREHGPTVWLSALAVDRCVAQCGDGVLALSSTDLVTWTSATAVAGVHTCNTEVARVEHPPASLPRHTHVMILEPFSFMLLDAPGGDLSTGWFPAPNATAPSAPSGGPSIRFEGGYYYVITGGHKVYLARSRDLRAWEPAVEMAAPSAADAVVAPRVREKEITFEPPRQLLQ
jgi:hypothetical protein